MKAIEPPLLERINLGSGEPVDVAREDPEPGAELRTRGGIERDLR